MNEIVEFEGCLQAQRNNKQCSVLLSLGDFHNFSNLFNLIQSGSWFTFSYLFQLSSTV